MNARLLSLAIAASLAVTGAAYAGKSKSAKASDEIVADWHTTITSADLKRLRQWRMSFTTAIAKAREGGNGAAIEREGILLNPDAALDGASPPAGKYRCRVIKLGAKTERSPSYVAQQPYDCEISAQGEVMGFSKLEGMQRPNGLFFQSDSRRMIFLGTLILGDETRAMDYGTDAARDIAGALERIGPQRWRLVLPWPRFESLLDVIEIVPADMVSARMSETGAFSS